MRILGLVFCLLTNPVIGALEQSSSTPKCSSEIFNVGSAVSGISILSLEAKSHTHYTSPGPDSQSVTDDLDFCQVKIYLTHQTEADNTLGIQNTKDRVLVEVWLPLSDQDWNGRFQATGGGGFVTGMFGLQLGIAVKQGYAAVSTDGGHDADRRKTGDASWALREDGTVNWHLLQNFASRSLVEQIHIGKLITEQYYGTKPHHSYWNGCSTGGRQGYAIAQKYPHLVDGILANAPAIGFTGLVTGEFWPQLRMALSGTYMSNCELDYYRAKTIEACDQLDGAYDGVLEDPEECHFNAFELARDGHNFECDGRLITFTNEMAQLVFDIHRGPTTFSGAPLFPGISYGTSMNALANISVSEDGARSGNPFRISVSWLKHLVFKDPAFNVSQVQGLREYVELFGSTSYEYGGLLNADNPDLSALRDSGTKLLTWHGQYDQLIPYQNTVNYRRKVDGIMGGAHNVDDYYRLFLAPGVEHCEGGIGPGPKDPLAALVDWVEHSTPPETLDAETVDHDGELVTRDLCAWPAKSKYMGVGSVKRASSWSCVGGTERLSATEEPHEGIAQQVMKDIADRLQGLGLDLSIG